jgi:hypothetical protein
MAQRALTGGQAVPRLQNTRGLSHTVAHLGLRLQGIGQDRLAPDPVVVGLGGQPSQRCRAPYLRVMATAGHRARSEVRMNLDLLAGVAVPALLACRSDWQPHLGTHQPLR